MRGEMLPSASHMELLAPDLEHLAAYTEALTRGWSPNNVRDVSGEQLEAIGRDRVAFLASLLAQTGTITLPDGRQVSKLPSRVRWLWDGEFAGQISLRWQPGTDRLPDYVLGHIPLRWCHGSGGVDMPRGPLPTCCARPATSASRASKSQQTWTIRRHNA
jgi:hypothetical protein